ncbi:uncharacterized protein LOC111693300 [Trichogramma pretiosum]|uniref:uncharacterized protein LOC111693300 n=1 Tax=Trichogramma pretiosum TaxID=7493 RepID=UPI000C718CF0|nr:uncharacterized protein LOC111693300 [Trichogramma pretiosum]
MMSEFKRDYTPVGKGTNVSESNPGSYRVQALVASGSPSDSGEGKNREVVGVGRGARSERGGKNGPGLGKSQLPFPRVIVQRGQGGKVGLLEMQRLERERERALRERRPRSGETPAKLDSTAIRSRSDSGKEVSSNQFSSMEYIEASGKRTIPPSDLLLPDWHKNKKGRTSGDKGTQEDGEAAGKSETGEGKDEDSTVIEKGGEDSSEEEVEEEVVENKGGDGNQDKIYSEDRRVQQVMLANARRKEERMRSRELELAEREVDYLASMHDISQDLVHHMALETSKIPKMAAAQVSVRVSALQKLVSGLVAENCALKARLEEKERVEEQLWAQMKEVCSRGEVVVNQPEPRVQEEEERTPVKRSFAVVVRGKGLKEGKDVQSKLERVEKGMGFKVKGVRSLKEGRVLVELADEAERKSMLEDRRLREAGLRVEKPKTFSPLVLIRAVPKGMKDDKLLDEVYIRNLKEEVDAEEMERTMRVKFRIGARSREKEGVVLEVSPRIRQALLGTGSEARLYIGMRVYFVEAFERVSRCFGCYGFNHRAAECKRGKLCSRCCKEGHLAADCREQEECGNCREKRKDCRHSVLSRTCPEMLLRLERWKERVKE